MFTQSRLQKWKTWTGCFLGLSCAASSMGCSRTFWRTQADTDTYEAITEHLTDRRWGVPRIDITPDPRSRFYDPYDPDCAPLPPDDPAAHTYMHWVNGWEGYKCWHQFGDLMSVENPQWLANFGMSSGMLDETTGEYVTPVPILENVTLAQAIELSQIHNREYQLELEDLFLNALDVTFERYQLGIRYLEPTGGVSETLVEGGGTGRFNVNSIGLQQSLPWGTQLVASLANTTLWSFGAGGQSSSVSNMSFQILQPLLNDSGRKVNLENLTQVERNLLYQARDLARFRKILFSDIVSDYLGILSQIQAIRNEHGNIVRLEEQVKRLLSANQPEFSSANVELSQIPDFVVPDVPLELNGKLEFRFGKLIWRGLMTAAEEELLRNLRADPVFQELIDELKNSLPNSASGLDVLQLQFDLTNSVNRLRGLERGLQDNLDSFKISLGLPPDMIMTIDDFLLKPFEVIDPLLLTEEQSVKDFILRVYIDDAVEQEKLTAIANDFSTLLANVRRDVVELIGQDLHAFEAALPKRMLAVETAAAQLQLRSDFVQARDRYANFVARFNDFEATTQAIQNRLNEGPLAVDDRIVLLAQLIDMRQDLLLAVQNAAVIQVSSRVELIEIAEFDLPLDVATKIALEQRLDLMNARARVMDSRRRIEVIANDLKSVLDIGVSGNLSTDPGGTDPFDFRSDTGQITASISFDTPLDQINERNAYREALVVYQRERRNYMAIEDRVKADVRAAWRQLNVLRQNLETARLAVRIAALQYESAVGEGNAPVDPRQVLNNSNRASGNQGQNLTRALSSILTAQNQLIQFYVSYERNRLNIYRDMGIMEIGPDGVWNDEVYRNLDNRHDQEIKQQSRGNSTSTDAPNVNATVSGAHTGLPAGRTVLQAAAWSQSALGEGVPARRDNDRVSLAGGDRVRDEDDGTGVVELRYLFGQFQQDPSQPADSKSRQRAIPGQPVGAGKY